jgi:hypothetical protein
MRAWNSARGLDQRRPGARHSARLPPKLRRGCRHIDDVGGHLEWRVVPAEERARRQSPGAERAVRLVGAGLGRRPKPTWFSSRSAGGTVRGAPLPRDGNRLGSWPSICVVSQLAAAGRASCRLNPASDTASSIEMAVVPDHDQQSSLR